MQWKTEKSNELFSAILGLETLDDAQRFFRDLLTAEEIVEFSTRFRVARLLSEGVPYIAITRQTGLSSTTIARISKWLKNGMNGYTQVLKRTSQHHALPREG